MKTPEGYEKDDVDKYLKSIGAYVVKSATFGYGGSGHADRVCCIDGTFWSLEVKREGKKPTKLQELRMAEVLASGGEVAWGVALKITNEIEMWRNSRGLK